MMRTIVCVCVALLATAIAVQADETTRHVQEELRKRNLYFGDIDGQSSPELIGALKRYQKRKGFEVTGDVDGNTAASLHVQSTIAFTPTQPEDLTDLPIVPEPPAEAPAASQDITPERVNKFVETYLRVGETEDIGLQVWFYKFPVDYFDDGQLDQARVFADTQRYVKRWPVRKYTLQTPISFFASDKDGETILEFSYAYTVRNNKRVKSGRMKAFWSVRADGHQLKIVAIREERLPNK
jgi:peptidoglycan hydrolase-like protein with peptidoglycan-binding domain